MACSQHITPSFHNMVIRHYTKVSFESHTTLQQANTIITCTHLLLNFCTFLVFQYIVISLVVFDFLASSFSMSSFSLRAWLCSAIASSRSTLASRLVFLYLFISAHICFIANCALSGHSLSTQWMKVHRWGSSYMG